MGERLKGDKMKKVQKATLILLPRENRAICPIYEHEGKYYIKANKPNTSSFSPFVYNGEEYREVRNLQGAWFAI